MEVKDWLGTVSESGGEGEASGLDAFVAAAGANLTLLMIFVFVCFAFYVIYKFCRKKRRFLLRMLKMNHKAKDPQTAASSHQSDTGGELAKSEILHGEQNPLNRDSEHLVRKDSLPLDEDPDRMI